MGGFPVYFWAYVVTVAIAALAATVAYRRRYCTPDTPDKLVIDLSTVEPGQIIDLPTAADIRSVEFINPLDPQDYVLKKYVTASSVMEAVSLDAQTPVAECFIADEQVKFQGRQADAVGFQSIHPEEE